MVARHYLLEHGQLNSGYTNEETPESINCQELFQGQMGPHEVLPIHAAMLTDLILLRFCVGNYSCCVFMSAMLCHIQETVSQYFFLSSGSYHLSALFPMVLPEPTEGNRWVDNAVPWSQKLLNEIPVKYLIVSSWPESPQMPTKEFMRFALFLFPIRSM